MRACILNVLTWVSHSSLRVVALSLEEVAASYTLYHTRPMKVNIKRTLVFELFVRGRKRWMSRKDDSMLNRRPYNSSASVIVRCQSGDLIRRRGPAGVHSHVASTHASSFFLFWRVARIQNRRDFASGD